MSIEASEWARRQQGVSMSQKAVLRCLGDYANDRFEAWPAQGTICLDISANKKTVREALEKLSAVGLIIDTGKREGRTGQVVVWRLAVLRIEAEAERYRKRTSSSFEPPQARRDAACEPAESEDNQKRDPLPGGVESASKTVPDLDSLDPGKGTGFTLKGDRFYPQRGPVLDHEPLGTIKEPSDGRAPPASNEAAPSRDGFQDPSRIQVTEHDRESGRRKTDALLAAWDQPEPEAKHG